MLAARDVISIRSFRRFWIGQTASTFGNGFYEVAFAWAVYQSTHSTLAMGGALTLVYVPQILFALLGGILTDRTSRRHLFAYCDMVGAIVVAVAAALSHSSRLNLPALLILSFVVGSMQAIARPASLALLPVLVPDSSRLQLANSVSSGSAGIIMVVAPAIGGLVVSLAGVSVALLVDAGSFLVGAIMTLSTGVDAKASTDATDGFLKSAKSGLHYVACRPWLRTLIVIGMIINLFCIGPFFTLIPAVVRARGFSAATLGFVMGAVALGTTIGSLGIARQRRRVTSPTLMFGLSGIIGIGLVIGGMGSAVGILLVGALLFGVGLSADIIIDSIIQLRTPDSILGRVGGVVTMSSFIVLPISYLGAGAIGHGNASEIVLSLGGGLGAIAIMAVALIARHSLAEESAHASRGLKQTNG